MGKTKLLDKACKLDAVPEVDFPYNSLQPFFVPTTLADCRRLITLDPVSPRQQVIDSHFRRCYHLEIDFEVVACDGWERRPIMETYVLLLNFTDQGIRNVKDTIKRAETFRRIADKAAVKVKEVYWTLGQHDGVLIFEAPDEATATALGLSLGTLGNVRTQTLRAFSAEEIGRILSKMP